MDHLSERCSRLTPTSVCFLGCEGNIMDGPGLLNLQGPSPISARKCDKSVRACDYS